MEEGQKTPLTDYYSKPYQGKRYRENSSESLMVSRYKNNGVDCFDSRHTWPF